ncbi:hypothetical protein [Lysinibacillus xylanilyticus]|uniref:hypothetical protein n=1 Tax=Lysinibacillus xylanilyticus TaxID=582475 RepID=UPI003D030325
MLYKDIKKTKLSKMTFFSVSFFVCILFFLIYFGTCVSIHTKYLGDYPTTLLGTIFVFLIPPILTIPSTYIISISIFYNQYINKNELSKMKDLLAHISVFTTILVNSIEKFYSPNGDTNENYNWFFTQLLDFFNTSIQPINYMYTIPILFSMMTIILLALERTKIITKRNRRKMMYPSSYPSFNPVNVERAKQISNEIDILRRNTFPK